MRPYLNSILEKVPGNIRLASQEYISEHVAVFEPKEYVNGQMVNLDHYHFVIFNSTPPLLKIGRREYQFHKGSLMSLEPEMDLTVVPFDGRVMGEYSAISVSRDFFEKIAVEALDNNKIKFKRIENSCNPHLFEIVGNFKHEILNYSDKYPVMVNSIATQVAFQLLRDVNADTPMSKRKGCYDYKYINKALEYMEINSNYNITIEEICREIYVSPAHFGRMFKYHTGQSPHRYLIGIRIQRAKEMLKRAEVSIEEAARLSGFVSISHFSTVFKRTVGMKPSEYRKAIY
jgi:AraC family transcriptional regulator